MLIDRVRGWGEATFRDPVTVAEIAAAEADLGHPLPEQLCDLLVESNGIDGEYGLGLLWPVNRIAADNRAFRDSTDYAELYMPFNGLVFFADAGNGDQFGVSLSGNNEVFAWDHESDSRMWVASTVLDYLERWMTGELHV